jgi:hypothetical protein
MSIKKFQGIATLVFTLGCLFLGYLINKSNQTFSLRDVSPVVLGTKGNEVFQYWEFEDKPLYWEVDPKAGIALKSYRDSLELVLGKDIFKTAVQKEANQSKDDTLPDSVNGDRMNAHLVHSGRIGKIRSLNLLEAELLSYQLDRYPLLSHPTEFHGFILTNDSLKHLRVYFAASDQPWPPKPSVIIESIKTDLKQGWKLSYHLHNHYEPKANNYVGILAPSMADAQFFRFLNEDFGLTKALVTNGFHTVEIESRDFSKLKAHGDE